MAAVAPAGWLQNAGNVNTAALLRTYTGSMLGGLFAAGALTRTRGGVQPALGGQLAVTQNGTPNMSVNVASGIAYVPGTEAVAQGVYFCYNDGTVNLAIATAPSGGQSRIDLVVAQIQDTVYSGGTDAWSLAVVTGTPAVSPSVPTAPVDSITIAQIAVGTSVTSIVTGNITDKRFYASSLGGLMPITSSTERTALAPYTGMPIYRLDTKRMEIYNGTTWDVVRPFVAPVVANGGLSVTTTETTFLTCNWTQAQTNDPIRVTFSGQCVSNGDNRQTTIKIKEDGTIIATLVIGSPASNHSFPAETTRIRTPTAGAHTYIATGTMDTFTGAINSDAQLSVELS
jgi:hypothetical protein